MSPLLARSSWRTLGRHPWQASLATLGVALGVAVVVAIQLASSNAQRAFELATDTVAGRATHQVVGGPLGLDQGLYPTLRRAAPEVPAAPVVEAWVSSPALPGRALRLLGLDPLAEGPFRAVLAAGTGNVLGPLLTRPGGAVLPAGLGRALGLTVGQPFQLLAGGRRLDLELVGLLPATDAESAEAFGDVILVDVASAQELLGVTTLSRIDLVVSPAAAAAGAVGRLQAVLPADATLATAAARTRTVSDMTRAFRLNLTALALLALLCGTFLIYNSTTFSVVQRRTWIGTLRALGVTRREILGLVLGEALATGLLGAVLGLGLGVALARGLLRLVARTLNDLYFAVAVRDVEIVPWVLAAGAFLGLAATALAALPPALEATSTPPRAVLARSTLEEKHRRGVPRAAVAGVLLVALGGLALALPGQALGPAFLGLLLVVLGAACLAPAGTLGLLALARPLLSRLLGWRGRLAAAGVSGSLSRTAVAISALMIAVSVTSGVGIMIASFRSTVVRWLDATLAADLYLVPPGRANEQMRLADSLRERLAAVAGVERVNSVTTTTVTTAYGSTAARIFDLDTAGRGHFELLQGDPAVAWPALDRGEGLLVSEPFAYRHGLAAGSTLAIATPAGQRPFQVAGVYADYGSDQGAVLFTRAGFSRHWPLAGHSAFAVLVAPGASAEAVRERLRAVAAATGQELEVRSNRALKAASLVIFDRTFTITRVLRLLAGVVAFAGVLAALMALTLEKGRELAVLRAGGLTPGELWWLVTTETGLLGALAGVLSLPVGLTMAALMIYVINRRSFGWTIHFELAPSTLLEAVALAVAAALLAGLYPAWKLSRTPPAAALREE